MAVAMLPTVIAGCNDQDGRGGVASNDGSLQGELAVYVSDTFEGHTETSYFLRDAEGLETRLVLATDDGSSAAEEVAKLTPGTRLKVFGVPAADGLRVVAFEELSPAPAVTSALIGATPFAARTFAFVLVDTGGGISNVTPDSINAVMTTDASSIRNYYLDDSYGTQDISTQVIGPLKYSMPDCSTSTTSAMAKTLRTMVTGTFQHYLWYLGTRNSSCSWAGLASVGTPQSPSRDTWYNSSTNCVVLVQEPGHNFGMQHSSSLACTGASFADDPNSCTASEYGDVFDPMGGGCRHMNAWQKSYQGWLSGCNGVKIAASGTFTLLPFELQCNGPQFLQIKAPKTRKFNRSAAGGGGATIENLNYYYVELRTPVGFDNTLGNSKGLTPMVLVHVADDLRSRTQQGVHTFLLDMTPTTTGRNGFNDAGLAQGQTFKDPGGGLSITAQSVSASSATIVVTYDMDGAPATCLDGSMFVPPGSSECTGAPPTATGGAGGRSGGAAGSGGSGGGGATGAGGAMGSAGRPGSGGTGGHAGAIGMTGAAGQPASGSGGTGGSFGTSGQAGTSGSAGTTGANGGSGPVNGAAGTGTAGSSGMLGAAGHGAAAGHQSPGEVVGGCSVAGDVTPGRFGILMFAAAATALARRRRSTRLK